MREDVIREIVTRLMTDEDFREALVQKPGSVLVPYGLDSEEQSALQAQLGEGGITILETRLSASLGKSIATGSAGNCGCGCVSPKKCDSCG